MRYFSLFLTIIFTSNVLAQNILDQERVAFRFKSTDCASYYIPNSPSKNIPFDVGTGFELTNNDNHSLELFQQKVEQLIEEIGEEDFLNGRFYVTGEPKRGETSLIVRQTHYKTLISRAYKEILESNIGLDEIDLQAISTTSGKLSWNLENNIEVLTDKITAWFPSKLRHWEKPTRKEIAIALITTALIETLTAAHIVNDYNGVNMWALLATHSLLLITYDVVKRGMVNWIVDPNVSAIGKLNKQLLSSIPFILSFVIAGNITGVSEFFQSHDFMSALNIIATKELPNFVIKSIPTSAVQTVFYLTVMSNWLGLWWSMKDKALRMKAKSVQEVVKIPILLINSYLFALASTGKLPIWELGDYGSIGWAHIGIGLMAAAGLIITKGVKIGSLNIKARPNLLDPLIKKQDWILGKWETTKEFRALYAQRIRKLLGIKKKQNL